MNPVLYILSCAIILLGLSSCTHSTLVARSSPTVLIVTAHPDDESGMAATVWKITHALKGNVDLALVTNAEGGYKYSSLGNIIYGRELTDEDTGRALLPAIRKKELMAGGDIIGIRNYFFLDQQDHRYTLNVDSTLGYVWDTSFVVKRLTEIVEAGEYDYIFCMLPTPGTHGHHKGATVMALEAVSRIAEGKRPVVLGVSVSEQGDSLDVFKGLEGYPRTTISRGLPSFQFDRTTKFGYKDRLDYKIIVNWLIAEHKSQGTMQLAMNRGDLEEFWWFDMNDREKFEETRELFRRLAETFFEELEF
ncbi:MAG: PIG-L family deacetylase [Chlorobi bacterium]|nr:PIG-L family deacetylase [Chlorobiota bacterium]